MYSIYKVCFKVRNSKYLFFLLFFFLSAEVRSEKNNIVFHGAYTFETFIGQNASTVYVSIFNNTDRDLVIKSLSTDVAENAEIHNINGITHFCYVQMNN